MLDMLFDSETYTIIVWSFVAIAAMVFPFLFFISAPYGRHTRTGWGPQINSTFGWVIMEVPAVIVVGSFFFFSDRLVGLGTALLFVLWNLHYVNRSLIFPFRRRGKSKPMPMLIAIFAFIFNLINGYLQGGWLFAFGPSYGTEWLVDPRFLLGSALFLFGFALNIGSDQILFNLRKPGESGYKIPVGGFYRYVSSPNYLGEILEWTGWTIACWSPAGLAFLIWTVANLAPRAKTNHDWYKQTFQRYPIERKRLIPYVW